MSANLLALFDDVAAALDDVAIMTKTAMEKTSGIITDDLAVNVGQVDGVKPAREIPVVLKIFWGSLVNKVIIIPFVLLLLYYSPIALKYILLLGGVYLSYEGVHKVIEKLSSKKKEQKKALSYLSEEELKEKVFGAIKTDFVLSIEILVIAQSTLKGALSSQAVSLCIIGLLVSILIYGLVALLVKIDDFGLWLIKKDIKKLGMSLVKSMPYMMKFLGFVGTIAMLLVGGGIFTHHFHWSFIPIEPLQNIIAGLGVGFIVCLIIPMVKKLKASF